MTTILIVDDNKSNAQLIKVALENHGYTVLSAFDGKQGLELAIDQKPALIVVDLRLPGSTLDGWELIRVLRAQPDFAQTPIFVTSVEVTPEDRKLAYEAGCDLYFSKPFSIKDLREQIAEFISVP